MTLVRWSNKCNNRCAMCSLRCMDGENAEVMPYEEAKNIVRRNSEEYSRIEFTGGEPTVDDRILELVALARQVGYTDIGVGTNGRRFSDKVFCDGIIEAGLTRATIALHGHDAEVHEKITSIPGSFNETTLGIRNLLESSKVIVSVVSVLNRMNYATYHKIGELVSSLGVSQWGIADLVPDGRAYDNYDELSLTPIEAYDVIQKTKEIFGHLGSINIFNFSRCFFPKELERNVEFFDTRTKAEFWKNDGIEGRMSEDNGIYRDKQKVYLPFCLECSYYKDCGGFWTKNVETYGLSGIKEVALKNKFIPDTESVKEITE